MARIVVVEDDEGVGQALMRVLTYGGHVPLLCPTAAQALQALEATGADLLITDLFLPDKPGLALIAELGNVYPHLPLIVMTGHPQKRQDLEDAKRLGAVAALIKPFPMDLLLTTIGAALGQQPEGGRQG